jgi:hypothetical protein
MPHAMQNHQATSKKSFRIRPKHELDMLKMNFSNAAKSSKDLMEMNEGKFIQNYSINFFIYCRNLKVSL